MLKEKQKKVILEFMLGNDVFCCLPTGYGKSLCYALLPLLYDSIRCAAPSIVVCISPLIALMIDQKEKFTKMGISTEFISQTYLDLDGPGINAIKEGAVQLLFISPESLLNNRQWRSLLLSEVYNKNLVCVAIDEAHCVPKW
jgi:bloom syndrome protein